MKASKNKLLYRPLNLKRFMKQIFTGLAFCLGLSLSTVQAQNGVFNVNLDTIFQTANALNGGTTSVTFEGVNRTIDHGFFTAHALADAGNGGPWIIRNNYVDIVTCNLGTLMITTGVQAVRFLGFTLSGVEADLANITTESLNFRSTDENQSFDVAANTLQIGFNSIVPRTTLTDNFFASSASNDRMGTIQLTLNRNGAGNISSNLRITSLKFELSSVVPEPQSYALFAAALAGFAVYFRKNKIKA